MNTQLATARRERILFTLTESRLLTRWLNDCAAKTPDECSVHYESSSGIWVTESWSQTASRVSAISKGLRSLEFQSGDHIALVGPLTIEQIWIGLAAISLGGNAFAVNDHGALTQPGFADYIYVDDPTVLSAIELLPASMEIVFNDRRYSRPRGESARLVPLSHLICKRNDSTSDALGLALPGERDKTAVTGSGAFELAPISPRCAAVEELVDEFHLTIGDRTVASNLFYSPFHMTFGLALWLRAGLELIIGESAADTIDFERKWHPTYRYETNGALERWCSAIRARFGKEASFRRRFVEWGIAQTATVDRSWFVTSIADFVVAAPLRRKLDVNALRALVVEQPVSNSATRELLLALRIPSRGVEDSEMALEQLDALESHHERLELSESVVDPYEHSFESFLQTGR